MLMKGLSLYWAFNQRINGLQAIDYINFSALTITVEIFYSQIDQIGSDFYSRSGLFICCVCIIASGREVQHFITHSRVDLSNGNNLSSSTPDRQTDIPQAGRPTDIETLH